MGTKLCKNTAVNEFIPDIPEIPNVLPYAERLNKSWVHFQALFRGHSARKRVQVRRSRAEAVRLVTLSNEVHKTQRRGMFEQNVLPELMLKVLKKKVLGALAEYGDIPWDNWDIELCPCLLMGILAIMK